jgi:hypothetical protein
MLALQELGACTQQYSTKVQQRPGNMPMLPRRRFIAMFAFAVTQ